MVLIILNPAVLFHVVEPGPDEPDCEVVHIVGRVKFRVSQKGRKRKSCRLPVFVLGQVAKDSGNTTIPLELLDLPFRHEARDGQAAHYGVGRIQANETKGSGKCGDVLFLFVQRIGQGVDGSDMEEVDTRWPYKAARAWLLSSAVQSIGALFVHRSHALRDMTGLVVSVTARLTRAKIDDLFTKLSVQ